MVTYNDDTTWKQHYEEWKRLLEESSVVKTNPTRLKTVKDMVAEYERGESND